MALPGARRSGLHAATARCFLLPAISMCCLAWASEPILAISRWTATAAPLSEHSCRTKRSRRAGAALPKNRVLIDKIKEFGLQKIQGL